MCCVLPKIKEHSYYHFDIFLDHAAEGTNLVFFTWVMSVGSHLLCKIHWQWDSMLTTVHLVSQKRDSLVSALKWLLCGDGKLQLLFREQLFHLALVFWTGPKTPYGVTEVLRPKFPVMNVWPNPTGHLWEKSYLYGAYWFLVKPLENQVVRMRAGGGRNPSKDISLNSAQNRVVARSVG